MTVTSRDIIEASRPIRTAMSLNSNDSANPREISFRSAKVNILRTTGNPSPPNIKIKCYDRLNSGCRGEIAVIPGLQELCWGNGDQLSQLVG